MFLFGGPADLCKIPNGSFYCWVWFTKGKKKTFYGLLAFLYRTQKREGHSQEMGPAENLTKPSRQSRKDKMGVVSFKKIFLLFVFTVFGNRGGKGKLGRGSGCCFCYPLFTVPPPLKKRDS